MNQSLKLIDYYQITEKLKDYALSKGAKDKAEALKPFLSKTELLKNLRDTTQARRMLTEEGTPPLPAMENIEEYIDQAVIGELLAAEHIEATGLFLAAVRRMKAYLERGRRLEIGLAYYSENLDCLNDLREDLERSVRNGRVDDYASAELRGIRRQLTLLEEKLSAKAEQQLKANKAYVSESFVVRRNGRLCIPVKKEHKNKLPGAVIDRSSTGATLFIEPQAIMKLQEELELYRIMEDSEERRILYELMNRIAEHEVPLRENIRVITMLDFVFAKGKLSAEMDALEPTINLERRIRLNGARHPMLDQETCVPIDFHIGEGIRGVIITGPNTGGKTVAIKTVALLSAMACSGLHIPCAEGDITMNSQILCDIGDGQDLKDNLSTFSAHIKNVLYILERVNEDSLVIMDELGSGTDPAEGMGIAIAILEKLRSSKALFLATTHYPEVKEYAKHKAEIVNARMAFDRESLEPLYRLEVGRSGESCALYIAKRLGIPNEMLRMAAKEAYGKDADAMVQKFGWDKDDGGLDKSRGPKLLKREAPKAAGTIERERAFTRGDSVTVLPEGRIGIVVKPADKNGNVLVQVQKEKLTVNMKRLKLKVAAAELYPEDYDFSIIFDTVENRKARHKMGRRYEKDLTVEITE